MPPDGARLVVGFSGGPDSAALLHALAGVGHWSLLAVHVDHAMRPESAADADAAAGLAREFRVDCRVVRLSAPPAGEAAARDARHGVLAGIAREIGSGAIALGHTADDQVETVLMRVTRGTGLSGLRAMSDWETGPEGVAIARPLLGLTRQDVESYLAAHGIAALADPSNADPAFADRNRVRLEAVPPLRRINPRLTAAVARLASLAAEDDDALQAWAERDRAALAAASGDPQILPLRQFQALPLAIRRRVLRLAAPDLTFDQVEQVLGLAASPSTGHTHLPGGRLALRFRGRLEIRQGPPPGGSECRLCLTQGGLVPSMEREFGNQ